MVKILVIDDERSIRNTLTEILEYEGYSVDTAEEGHTGLDMLLSGNYNLALTDVKMPGLDGLELLQAYRHKVEAEGEEAIPIIMISGHANIDMAVEALKIGAFDFLEKPLDLNRVLNGIKNALEKHNLVEEARNLRRQLKGQRQMIGQSEALRHVRDIIEKVAGTEARVLITGSNGTGKEVVAHLLHENSPRAKGPMVEVNCAAIPGELIESELFGHIKGSFTGAVKDRAGKFEQADGGTLFLDEIGDMSLSAQTKVLRALQESEITRVGSDKTIKVNVRVIAATNKDLSKEIALGQFREDLFHRLNVIPIHVPDLADRLEDIPLLVTYFTQQICSEQGWKTKQFNQDAIAALQQRPWPGNIRELRNVIERLIILSSDTITADDVAMYA